MRRKPLKRSMQIIDGANVTLEQALHIAAFANGPVLFTNLQAPDNPIYMKADNGTPKAPENN